MASYFISYDLRNEGDYQPITDELEKFNAIRVLESCWRFKRYSTDAKALEKYFSNFINITCISENMHWNYCLAFIGN